MTARLIYRPVGESGAPYPQWLRELKDKSGAYVIRERGFFGGWEVVYVGESHSGRLYQTLTRHFQQWRREKTWWITMLGRPHDPGTTYPRERCEVAFRLTAPGKAIAMQYELVERLRPRDNLIGWPAAVADEAVPF